MKFLDVLAIAAMAILVASPAFAALVGDAGPPTLPEPGTLALLAGGVATALFLRRGKK